MTATESPLDILASIFEPPPEPLPEFVAAQRPTSAEFCRAALRLGWLPDEPYLRPAVPRLT